MYVRDALFIGGEWRQPVSPAVVEVVSPSTEDVIGSAPDAGEADVNAAVAAARRALDAGDWRNRPMAERIALIEQALILLKPRSDEIARLITSEMGAPISVTTQLVPGALWAARYFMGVAAELPVTEIRRGMNTAAVLREPVGVVASIAPWNGPFNLAMAKIVPALLAGCSVVFKPAPETPLDVYHLVEALAEAGLPAGVLNLVTGGRETGEALVAHPDVDKVSFTGSTAAGHKIGAVCGEAFKRVQLELGGKSAAIILDDADLPTTMAGLAMGSFFNSGQVCAAYSRVLAPRSRYDEVVDALCATASSFVVGDPFDPATTMGPLVAQRQRDRVEGYLAIGAEEGARIGCGGGRPAGLPKGWYVEPTVFVDVDPKMRIAQEEIFGPVVAVIPHDGVDDAIRIANDSAYGLHGAVFTTDEEAALRVARRVRTGTFSVNSFVYNIEAPFGGVKESGVGRDTGREGLEAYFELKTVNIPPTMERLFAVNVAKTPITGNINADEEYWEGLEAGEFRLPRCAGCGRWTWPAHFRCGACGSWDFEWTRIEPTGTVYSWTRTHYAFDRTKARAPQVPYVTVLAEVDGTDGARVLGVLAGDEAALRIGARVVGHIEPPSEQTLGYPAIRWTIADHSGCGNSDISENPHTDRVGEGG
jgi:acyl-CoA reductase-like NAD-dependent aldehyde dehydrogenase/uncharacterized OB-fold protein